MNPIPTFINWARLVLLMEAARGLRADTVLENFFTQIKQGIILGDGVTIHAKVTSIIVAGVGSSGLAGDLLFSYLSKLPYPLEIVHGYEVPDWATKDALVFIVSYSGNTEESIGAYRMAIRNGCSIVGIGSGGKLALLCQESNRPFVKVPEGYPAHLSIGFMFAALLSVLQNAGLVSTNDAEIEDCIEVLQKSVYQAKGKELAALLRDRTVILYSSDKMRGIAVAWKMSLNQVAKTQAYFHTFPDMCHGELESFTQTNPDIQAIILRVEDDTSRIQKRMDIAKDFLKQSRAGVLEIAVTGRFLLSKILSAVLLGLWTSYYLSIDYNVDPMKTYLIDDFKKRLAPPVPEQRLRFSL